MHGPKNKIFIHVYSLSLHQIPKALPQYSVTYFRHTST